MISRCALDDLVREVTLGTVMLVSGNDFVSTLQSLPTSALKARRLRPATVRRSSTLPQVSSSGSGWRNCWGSNSTIFPTWPCTFWRKCTSTTDRWLPLLYFQGTKLLVMINVFIPVIGQFDNLFDILTNLHGCFSNKQVLLM